MHSTFLFRYIYEEKGKDSRIYGIFIATKEGRKYFTMISRKPNWLKYLAYENKQILSL